MIITRPRDWARIKANLEAVGAERVFIMGCGECAAQCDTGGEPEVLGAKSRLEMAGYEVVGWTVGDIACHDNAVKVHVRKHGAAERADAVLVLACGAGTQSVADAIPSRPVFPGLESSFLGNVVRHGVFEERCSMCGDCVLDVTGGICPVTSCPKGLLNGPCGAMWQGRCEVLGDRDCVHVRIRERLAAQGRAGVPRMLPPKDHSAAAKPGSVRSRRDKEAAGE